MHHAYYILYIVYLLVILSLVFLDRKGPAQRLSWILLLVFLPGLGLLLYSVFGSDLYPRYRQWKLARRHGISLKRLDAMVRPEAVRDWPGDEPSSHLRRFHQGYCQSPFSADNAAEIFTAGHSKYRRLFEDLRAARKHIHVLYFAIHNDAIGKELTSILAEKAREGLEVRVLYDTVGGLSNPRSFFAGPLYRELRRAGGEVARIRPFPLDLNYRNHRKLAVIDGQIAYTGGMNIGDKYSDTRWRDTQVRITGRAVHQLQRVFLADWVTANKRPDSRLSDNLPGYFPHPDCGGSLGIQVIANGLCSEEQRDDKVRLGYLNMISSATERVWIQTPYFVPSDVILQALKAAAARGVDVRIMVPSRYVSATLFHRHIANYYLRSLVGSGARIYQYQDSYLHAKTMLVDFNRLCIGSVNLNARSLETDDELYVYFESPEFATRYEAIYQDDLRRSAEMDYEGFERQNSVIRAMESILSFLSPIL